VPGEVEQQVGADQDAARAVEEHDLVLELARREEHLVDLSGPLRLRSITEDAIPAQVAALALEARAGVGDHVRIGVDPRLHAEVVKQARRDQPAHGAESVDLRLQLG